MAQADYFEVRYIVKAPAGYSVEAMRGAAQDFLAGDPDLNIEDCMVVSIDESRAGAGYNGSSIFIGELDGH